MEKHAKQLRPVYRGTLVMCLSPGAHWLNMCVYKGMYLRTLNHLRRQKQDFFDPLGCSMQVLAV